MKKTVLIFLTTILLTSTLNSAAINLKNGTVLDGEIIEIGENSARAIVTIPLSLIGAADESFEKPAKREIPSPDSFMIVQGGAVPAPINTDRLDAAIRNGLVNHGYRILASKEGVIEYRLENKKLSLDMRFCYAPDEYWYEYIDSTGLDADIHENYISNRYFRWINILEREIAEVY